MPSPPLLDAYVDLAFAQAGAGMRPDASDAERARSIRRRIAALLCSPGMVGALYLTAWSRWNVAVAIASFGFLFGILWLYSERPTNLRTRLRARLSRIARRRRGA